MYPNISAPQSTNRPKNRNPYEVHRVDMSQFLPEMPEPKSFNNKQNLPKSFANSQKTKKITKPPPPMMQKAQQKQNAVEGFAFRNQQSPAFTQENKLPSHHTNNAAGNKIGQYISMINTTTSQLITDHQPFTVHQEEKINNQHQEPMDRSIESGFHQLPPDINLTAEELQEYKFLQQAQALPITEDSQPVSHILDNSIRDARIDAINDAIEEIVTNFNEETDKESLMKALDLILSCNIQELKSEVYFTELTEPFCSYIFSDMLDFETQLKILPFIIYFCEESMFGLNLDFNKIYGTLNQFIKNVYDDGNKKLPEKISPKINKAYVDIYKFLTEHLYMMDHSKLITIFDNFLDIILYNIQSLLTGKNFAENQDFIPFLDLTDDFASLYNTFIRKIEIRQIINKEADVKSKIIIFLNTLGGVLINHLDLTKEISQKAISVMLQIFVISCMTFKYNEFYNFTELKHSGDTIIIKCLELLNSLLINHKNIDYAGGLDVFTGLLQDLCFNLKLYEDKRLDFNRLKEKISETQSTIEDGETADLLRKNLHEPFKKIQKRIEKYQQNFISL